MAEIIRFEHDKADRIVTHILNFGIKYITATFDEENYLFTNDVCRSDMSAVLTIENHSQKKLYIENCNSGYTGTGPRQTKYLLTKLGVSEEMANQLYFCNGFKIQYDENNVFLPEKTVWELPFVSRADRCKSENIFFDKDYMAANLGKKQLYFIQPRGQSYQSLLRCVDMLEMERICFYIGSENSKFFTLDVPYNLALKQKQQQNVINGSCIYIEAKPFDVFYLVGNESPMGMLNAFYYYVTGKTLFVEETFGELVVGTLSDEKLYTSKMRQIKPLRMLKQILKNINGKQEIYYSLDLMRGK